MEMGKASLRTRLLRKVWKGGREGAMKCLEHSRQEVGACLQDKEREVRGARGEEKRQQRKEMRSERELYKKPT